MKKAEIVIGEVYLAKVSRALVPVRIDSVRHLYGGGTRGWTATNLVTGREIHVRSAARLRRRISAEELRTQSFGR